MAFLSTHCSPTTSREKKTPSSTLLYHSAWGWENWRTGERQNLCQRFLSFSFLALSYTLMLRTSISFIVVAFFFFFIGRASVSCERASHPGGLQLFAKFITAIYSHPLDASLLSLSALFSRRSWNPCLLHLFHTSPVFSIRFPSSFLDLSQKLELKYSQRQLLHDEEFMWAFSVCFWEI